MVTSGSSAFSSKGAGGGGDRGAGGGGGGEGGDEGGGAVAASAGKSVWVMTLVISSETTGCDISPMFELSGASSDVTGLSGGVIIEFSLLIISVEIVMLSVEGGKLVSSSVATV